MNQVSYQPPTFYGGPTVPISHPIAIVIDQSTVTGDVVRTPHVFGGISPLAEVASRIAAGLDPRSFIDESERWRADDAENGERVIVEAVDRAVGMATVYAHKLLAKCAAIGQLEIEQAQREAQEAATKANGNGRGGLHLP